MFQESRKKFRFRLWLYENAAICGMTAWIFVGFDTLLPSGKRFYFLQTVTTKSVFFFLTHGWHLFCEWHWNKIMHEHVKPKVMTKQVETCVWDTVFSSLNGANLKNKSPVWEKCLPVLTQILHSLPLVNSCRAADLPLNVFTFSSFDCSHMSKSHISCQIQ